MMKKQTPLQLASELLIFILSFIDRRQIPELLLVNKTWYQLIRGTFLHDKILIAKAQKYLLELCKQNKLLTDEKNQDFLNKYQLYFKTYPNDSTLRYHKLYRKFQKTKKACDNSNQILGLIHNGQNETIAMARGSYSFFKQNNSNKSGIIKQLSMIPLVNVLTNKQPLILYTSLKICLLVTILLNLTPFIISLLALLLKTDFEESRYQDPFKLQWNLVIEFPLRFLSSPSMPLIACLLLLMSYLIGIITVYEEFNNDPRHEYLYMLKNSLGQNSLAISTDNFETIPLEEPSSTLANF